LLHRIFLKLNDLEIEADNQEKVMSMLDLAAGRKALEELGTWITSRVRRLT